MKRVIIASVLSLLVIGGITFGYFYYKQLKMPQGEAIAAIPADAAFILEFKNPKSFFDKLKTNKIWQDMQSSVYYKDLADKSKFLDSVFSKDSNLKQLYCCQTVFVSAHYTTAHDFEFLYITKLPRGKNEGYATDEIKKIVGGKAEVSKRNYDGININEMKIEGGERTFAWSVTKGVFIGSFNAVLIEDAIRQVRIGKPFTDDKSFMKVFNGAGSITDANIFINYKMFPKVGSTFLNEENSATLNDLANFANWTEFDLKIKTDALVLNGFTYSNDSTTYLNTLASQQPRKIDLVSILPRRTAVLMYTGLSDFNRYYKDLQTYLSVKGLKTTNTARIKQLDAEYGISMQEKLIKWIDNEFALFITESNSANYSNNAFAVFRAKDIELAKKSLLDLNKAITKKEKTRIKEEIYRDNAINFINLRGVYSLFFGPSFDMIDKMFYTTFGNYVVFGNQASSIRSLVDDYATGKLLIKDVAYQNLNSNISSTTNCYLYVNLARSLPMLKGFFSERLNEAVEKNMGLYSKFDAFALQISNEGSLMYNNVYLQYNGIQKNDVNLLWSAQLDTAIAMTPQIVVNNDDKTNEIIVQDESNQLYLINNSGTVKWKVQLPEKIIGKVSQIDYYRNGKLQYLFNTQSNLYLLDYNGTSVGNYPIHLPSNASCGLSVFDYDNLREYRIFIPCDNDIVYGYYGTGKPLSGWLFNKPIGNISRPVQWFKIDGNDYLVIVDNKGAVYFLDRKGQKRFEVKDKVFTSVNNTFEIDSSEKDPIHFVTTDTDGKLVCIYMDGKVKTRKIMNLSPKHYFILKDINADGKKDLIFQDKDKLFVMNLDSSLIFKHSFDKEINTSPTALIMPNGKGKIGVASDQTNEIFLFNDDGSLYEGFPLKGSTSFSIGDFKNDGHNNIVVGSSDRTVYVYTVE